MMNTSDNVLTDIVSYVCVGNLRSIVSLMSNDYFPSFILSSNSDFGFKFRDAWILTLRDSKTDDSEGMSTVESL